MPWLAIGGRRLPPPRRRQACSAPQNVAVGRVADDRRLIEPAECARHQQVEAVAQVDSRRAGTAGWRITGAIGAGRDNRAAEDFSQA